MKRRRYDEEGFGQFSRAALLGSVVFLMCLFSSTGSECFSLRDNPSPAATVIDDETGRPIEGAVALAVWRKHSSTARAWWEGGTDVVVRIEEVVSDKDGNIFIEDFWSWHLFENNEPHLTIYKFGYVCWDQETSTSMRSMRRNDRLQQEKSHGQDEEVAGGFSFVGHETFIGTVTYSDYSQSLKIFSECI